MSTARLHSLSSFLQLSLSDPSSLHPQMASLRRYKTHLVQGTTNNGEEKNIGSKIASLSMGEEVRLDTDSSPCSNDYPEGAEAMRETEYDFPLKLNFSTSPRAGGAETRPQTKEARTDRGVESCVRKGRSPRDY